MCAAQDPLSSYHAPVKQTVVLTAALPPIAVDILSREYEVVVHDAPQPRSEEELLGFVEEADGLITLNTDPVTRRVLEHNPNLRVVGNYAVGVNNIDLDAARELGVIVTNTPGVLTDATADLAVALILAVTRRIVEGDRLVRSGGFTGWTPSFLLGISIAGKRLGILGMGRIGFATALRCRVFGMDVVYHSRREHDEANELLGARRVTLDELLATSDVISVHVPLTRETHHLIDGTALRQMKRTAVIINTSRGPIIDEAALAEALATHTIGGAGLDVYENEPSVHPALLPLDNVVLLPHVGSATEETRSMMARTVATDVALVLRGAEPRNRVV